MKQAVILGAGNIGRGFIGQLFSESGYFVTFVDVDADLLAALRSRKAYTIRLVTNERTVAVEVGPVGALHSNADPQAVAEAIARAEIGATAVGAGILKHIAPAVAHGLARRAELGNTQPFNLILCENLHGAARIFRDLVLGHLPTELHGFVAEHVGFVDTVIARMVPPLTPELRAEDPTLVVVEPYKELPVDREGFVGPIPPIVGMVPYAPFAYFTERKLYIHNAGHATLGYLGYLKGYAYGYEALADDELYFQTRGAMEESALALTRKFHPPSGSLLANIEDLLHRFRNRALGDTILRLGRDPIRKLAPGDRLAGAAVNACEERVTPVHLVTGLAAGLHFAHPEDPIAQALQQKIDANGIEKTLVEVAGISPDEELGQMILERYAELNEHTTLR